MAGGILLSLALSWGSVPGAALTLLGSVLPDIDHKDSLLGKAIPFAPKIFSHRGFTHSLAFTAACWLLSPYLACGVALHILMDMLTVSGVRLFHPFGKSISILNIKTGGTAEKLIFILIWIAIVVVGAWRLLPPGTEESILSYLQNLL